jgi:hypothetical protein
MSMTDVREAGLGVKSNGENSGRSGYSPIEGRVLKASREGDGRKGHGNNAKWKGKDESP